MLRGGGGKYSVTTSFRTFFNTDHDKGTLLAALLLYQLLKMNDYVVRYNYLLHP
jgi:hypothetical protein